MNDEKISQIKTNFNTIKELRINVMSCFNALEIKQLKLKKTTAEFITTNQHNLFIFGLDSFQFQSKLIDYEYADMKKYYFALNNRMYCEYYKLYKLILNYTEEILGSNQTITMLKANNIFPIYKDLEPFKQYEFEMISELHKTILVLLNDLHEHIVEKETKLHEFVAKQQTGLNINNFVNTYDYDIVIIRQKRLLYISYLEFFHNIHTKHFKRFSKKMKLMNDYLDEDIQFDEGMYVEIDNSSSIASFEVNDNVIVGNLDIREKKGFTSLFKSKVKNVMNTIMFKPKPLENMFIPALDTTNINQMLDSISFSCDTVLSSQQPLEDLQQAPHLQQEQPFKQEQPFEDLQPEQPFEDLQQEQHLEIEEKTTDTLIQEECKKKRKYTKRK